MARKKQLDKLSLDMIECEKAGYGVSYGRWKATQKPVKIVPKSSPDDWKTCPRCGQVFKPTHNQIYCDFVCQREAQRERDREKHNEYQREWRAKQERNVANG